MPRKMTAHQRQQKVEKDQLRQREHWPQSRRNAPQMANGPDCPEAVTAAWLKEHTVDVDGCLVPKHTRWNASRIRHLIRNGQVRWGLLPTCMPSCVRASHMDWRGKPKNKAWFLSLDARISDDVVETPEGHWEWTGFFSKDVPYASFRGESSTAVQMAWWARYEKRSERSLKPKCGKVWCINPEHQRQTPARRTSVSRSKRSRYAITVTPSLAIYDEAKRLRISPSNLIKKILQRASDEIRARGAK